jgi:hypothetical protein
MLMFWRSGKGAILPMLHRKRDTSSCSLLVWSKMLHGFPAPIADRMPAYTLADGVIHASRGPGSRIRPPTTDSG